MEPPEPTRPGAVRLIFEYSGQEVRDVSREPVDVLVPPTDPLDGYSDALGVWAEVRDASGPSLRRVPDDADHVAFLRRTGADRSSAATELTRFPLAGGA